MVHFGFSTFYQLDPKYGRRGGGGSTGKNISLQGSSLDISVITLLVLLELSAVESWV